MKLPLYLYVFFAIVVPGVFAAAAGSEPPMSPRAVEVYHSWNQDHLLLYNPWRNGVNRIPYYNHLIVAHPRLEQQALQYALLPGNGPYAVEHARGVTFAKTLIPSNSRPGIAWNLRQNGRPPHDATVFWRVDASGARLMRFDLWPAGAETQQRITMQEVIDRFRRR